MPESLVFLLLREGSGAFRVCLSGLPFGFDRLRYFTVCGVPVT